MTDQDLKILTLDTPEESVGDRLDRMLSLHPDLTDLAISRSRFKEMVKENRVYRQDEKGSYVPFSDPSHKVKSGEAWKVEVPPAEDPIPQPENLPLNIVFEDEDLIVIDKKAGMVVHPASGNWEGTLVNALLFHCGDSLSGIGGVKRPGIVHRIDKDTSGLMVVAKNDKAHTGLSAQFADHSLERAYQAVVYSGPRKKTGVIEGNIGRSGKERTKMAVVSPTQGKHAVTHYRVEERFGNPLEPAASLVICQLETGRTHQIRVHMTHIGYPLIGDPLYGLGRFRPGNLSSKLFTQQMKTAIETFGRQALHACLLGCEHPISGDYLRFESPLPDDMQKLVNKLRD